MNIFIRHDQRKLSYQVEIRRASSESTTEHEITMRRASSSNRSESRHMNAST